MSGPTVDFIRRIVRGAVWLARGELPERLRELDAREEIARSGLFDPELYRERYPGVCESGLDPLTHYVRHGAAEGRQACSLFDPAYYLRRYPDVATADDPLLHFLRTGADEGRWPNPLFNTRYYLRHNPAVERFGLNPLAHFLEVGARLGRDPHPAFSTKRYYERHPELDETTNPLAHWLERGSPLPTPVWMQQREPHANPERARIAVVLHLYYPDLWDEIRDALRNIPEPFRLFASLGDEADRVCRREILEAFPDATLRSFENRGRDIGPFLELLSDPEVCEYDIVCKIHSKKSAHRIDGERWRGRLLDGLLGSPDRVREILDVFAQNEHVGMLGAAESVDRSAASWGSNRQTMRELLGKLGLPRHALRLEFFAGSMFWFRPAALSMLRDLGLRLEHFEPERGQLDGTLHHAIERVFPLVAEAAGYTVRHFAAPARNRRLGVASRGQRVKLIAFYLPQFHPIPENDAWWGKGFTEWHHVTAARPLFEGHRQPRAPTELGYYDLRVPETREAQAGLAGRYGIHGFCYYYYWFDGRRLLDRPLREVVATGRPDAPFCICWANENWTRRWDGRDDDVLVRQRYSMDSNRDFIREVIPMLRDPRYIRYQRKPVLVVYRAGAIPRIEEAVEMWRKECRAFGVGDVHLCAVRFWDLADPHAMGFDAAVNFPPHRVDARDVQSEVGQLDPAFEGRIYDYTQVVRSDVERQRAERDGPLVHPGLMTAWDNTARRGPAAHIAHRADPKHYEAWLRKTLELEAETKRPESLVFLNAWNEWGEGAVLEPDRHHGRAYLEATRSALCDDGE